MNRRTLDRHRRSCMTTDTAKVMGWGTIIAILVATAVGIGVLLGLLGDALGWAPGRTGGGVGLGVGLLAANLISRRRAALAQATPPR
jgi:hypothetical protein